MVSFIDCNGVGLCLKFYCRDGSPVGECTELFVTRNSWLRVQLSVPSLQLAVRHARQSSRKPFDCFLIATAWITESMCTLVLTMQLKLNINHTLLDEGILLEVDRFDPGRLPVQGRENMVPTALIPGDVPIPCQVALHPPSPLLLCIAISLCFSIPVSLARRL